MKSFVQRVTEQQVEKGQIAVFWLGQAGFLLKTAAGHLVYIDPYFSNCCERHFGFRRLIPTLLEPADLPVDLLLISHAHFDHLDIDSIDQLVSMETMKIWAAKDAAEHLSKYDLPADRLQYLAVGDTAEYEDIRVEALACDHGELAPDALGFLITVDGKRIYTAGDTAYRADHFSNPKVQGVDLFIPPINGAFGNLNEQEAAKAAATVGAKMTVPCHFWNFAEHGGDPMKFKEEMEKAALPYTLLTMGGEPLVL